MELDYICIGEVLIDFIAKETTDLVNSNTFVKYPGGAAGNIAVGLSKMGFKAGVISKLGKDPFGDFLIDTLTAHGVDTSQIYRDDSRKTGLAFVALNDSGVPDFTFFRDNCASRFLQVDEINADYILSAKGIYFSSMSLVNEPLRSANYAAVNIARAHDRMISFDPNVRISLWHSEDEARAEILNMLNYVDILKINTDELFFLRGDGDYEELCRDMLNNYPNIRLLALTLGEKGCLLINQSNSHVYINAFNVPVVDTTGAGDAFFSALISSLLKSGAPADAESLQQLGRFANAASALTIATPGVIPAIPSEVEINAFLSKQNTDVIL
jgi:fructokinase